MKDTLVDIQAKLKDGAYQNEEHVRLALVARILQGLGWDVWNPLQVNAEFVPVPTEDSKKVDFALFSTPREPSVFIEVKAVGKLDNIEPIERQLRDYNKNITAPFCVITDGRFWRFYYSTARGDFASKLFKILDLCSDDVETAEVTLRMFLGKSSIDSGKAEQEASALLTLTKTQRVMEEYLPHARRLTQESPYPSLPDALVSLVAEQGFPVTRKEAEDFIERTRAHPSSPQTRRPAHEDDSPTVSDVIQLNPERPGSLRHTSIFEGQIGQQHEKSWNGLVCCGVKIALQRGQTVADLRKWITAQVEEDQVTDRGFHPIPGTNVSLQYMEANRAWENAFNIAKKLGLPIAVRFRWQANDAAAHPGKEGFLRWSP